MVYVFDNSSLIVLFNHFYPDRFPSLWERFELLKEEQRIISVREVANELERYAGKNRLIGWIKNNRDFFHQPNHEEMKFISEIFSVNAFQTLVRKQERLYGHPVADPFVVAKAKLMEGCVVTQETRRKNQIRIPNVCDHFGVQCEDLESFMEKENWKF